MRESPAGSFDRPGFDIGERQRNGQRSVLAAVLPQSDPSCGTPVLLLGLGELVAFKPPVMGCPARYAIGWCGTWDRSSSRLGSVALRPRSGGGQAHHAAAVLVVTVRPEAVPLVPGGEHRVL